MTRHWSERVAKGFLEGLGYHVLEENFTVRGGEIALIAKDGAVLVFAEVKQRSTARYGSAAEAIGAKKTSRVRRAALLYLVKSYGHDDVPVRFDAVLVEGPRTGYRVKHLKGVF